jgi:FHS family L-fucose permease-like MFS transporter
MLSAVTPAKKTNHHLALLIIGALFFCFGFLTWVNGTLIPYLRIACELRSDTLSFLVATSFFLAYMVMAIPSSYVLNRTGYKKGMSLGLLIMAAGTLLFIPAALIRSYVLFLTGLFITGTGLALLQTASNPYLIVLGPIESAGSRISIMGICNKVAGIIASMVFGYIALGDADQITASLPTLPPAARTALLDELASRVINPYIIITLVLVALAVSIYYSALPDIDDQGNESSDDAQTRKTSVFQFPHLLLGVLAIFLYLGVEVLAGDTIISYGKSQNIPLSTAKFFTTATLACMLLGYLVGIFAIPKYLSQQNALKGCAILGVAFSTVALVTNGYLSVLFIALLGLANSLMWPAIFPLAIDGLHKFTKKGSALLIMGIGGGAIIPLIYGLLADHSTQGLVQEGVPVHIATATAARNAYWIALPCYLYILYYAIRGYKAGRLSR